MDVGVPVGVVLGVVDGVVLGDSVGDAPGLHVGSLSRKSNDTGLGEFNPEIDSELDILSKSPLISDIILSTAFCAPATASSSTLI